MHLFSMFDSSVLAISIHLSNYTCHYGNLGLLLSELLPTSGRRRERPTTELGRSYKV
jgi:hypothetical protein